MLELRPNCECCNRDLPPESDIARICTFECTFCADCADNRRPIRPASKLVKFPASTKRVFKAEGCAAE
jgi:hypothetical protein